MATTGLLAGDRPPVRDRLVLHRNPLRMVFSPAPWSAGIYLLGAFIVNTTVFCLVATALFGTVLMSLLWIGVPLLLAAVVVIRGCGAAQRGLLSVVGRRTVGPTPMSQTWPFDPDDPKPPPSIITRVRTRWSDPVTWRHLGYQLLLFVPFAVLDMTAVTLWLGFLGYITVPIWYRYIPITFDDGSTAHGLNWGYFPHGPHGPGGWGVFVGDDAAAFATAGVSLVLFVACSYLVVAVARLHSRVAAAMLGPDADPLAPARRVLAEPGPLTRQFPPSGSDRTPLSPEHAPTNARPQHPF